MLHIESGMTAVAIPAWNARGVIPPINELNPTATERPPYAALPLRAACKAPTLYVHVPLVTWHVRHAL